jgi:transposase
MLNRPERREHCGGLLQYRGAASEAPGEDGPLDVHKLLTMLLRHHTGEQKVWSVVRVPSVADEDRRQLHRELLTSKGDRTLLINRIKGLLASQGRVISLQGDFKAQLEQQRLWDGSPIPVGLRQRLLREWEQLTSVAQRIAQLEAERRELIRTAQEAAMQKVQQLLMLRGIGTNSAWLFVMECFGWRTFRNAKAVGALSGCPPTPYASGNMAYELGILFIALWRFVETGVLPEGAGLKEVVRI